MTNCRTARRRRVLKGAILTCGYCNSIIHCYVRNLSDTGCLLRTDHLVPDTFTLTIELDGLEADCKVIWRRISDVGIQFTAPVRFTTPKRVQVMKPIPAPATVASMQAGRPVNPEPPATRPSNVIDMMEALRHLEKLGRI
jgi:hypothetical protein